jgi:hypothetical protein
MKRGKWSQADVEELNNIFQNSKSVKTALNKASRRFRRSKSSCYGRYYRFSVASNSEDVEDSQETVSVIPKQATKLVLSIKSMEIKDNKLIINL